MDHRKVSGLISRAARFDSGSRYMPSWYVEDDDGHLRCYYGGSGHELSECDAVHAALHKKWDHQRNMKPLPEWLQQVADARVFVPNDDYYRRSDDFDQEIEDAWVWAFQE